MKYYIQKDKEADGPYSIEELKGRKINSKTLVWHEGAEDWKEANKIDELKKVLPPPVATKVIVPPPITKSKKGSGVFLWVGALVLVLGIGSYLLYDHYSTYDHHTKPSQATQDRSTILDLEPDDKEINEGALNEQHKRKVRMNIKKYVLAKSSSYHVNELLGGITGLKIAVRNNSPYLIDHVMVKVDYIKTSGDVYRSRGVHFYRLGSNEVQTLSAPDSDRGTKIRYEITTIKSKELGL